MSSGAPEAVIYSGHPSWKSMLDFQLAGLPRRSIGERVLRLGRVDLDTAATDDSDVSLLLGIATPMQVVAAVDRARQLADRTAHTQAP